MRNDVEVFVPTCGPRPSLTDCLRALASQSPPVNQTVIRGLAPMSRAFSEMADRARCPLFVQVDDDMILVPTAVQRLVEIMEPRVGCGVLWLWDVHLQLPILGVKCYRTEAVRAVGGWRDVQGCEVDFNSRLKAAGWAVNVVATADVIDPPFNRTSPVIVGKHDPKYTPDMAFERYRDLTLKQRRFGQARWVEDLPSLFLRRVRSKGLPVDVAALAGCIAGMTAKLGATNREKDFTRREWLAEFELIERTLGLGG